jgi:anti-sigma factor RsiW
MTDLPYLHLIHAEIDGELDEHQRAALAGYLLGDTEARALRDGLRNMCAALDGMAAVEPPPLLRTNILAALPPMSAKPHRARRFDRWASPVWRYAAMFAGALIIGAVVYEAGDRRGPDASQVAGTMAGPGARPLVVLDSVQLDLGPARGKASLYRAGAGVGLELDLVSSAAVDVLVASGEQTLRISGVGGPDNPGGRRTAVVLPGAVKHGETVDLTFLAGGRQIGTARLSIPAGN